MSQEIENLWGEMPEAKPIKTGDGDILCQRAVKINKRIHPAEKPIQLVSRLLGKVGGVILDPFMGSATTGLAAVKAGRRFVGIEKDPLYYEAAKQRMVMFLDNEDNMEYPKTSRFNVDKEA